VEAVARQTSRAGNSACSVSRTTSSPAGLIGERFALRLCKMLTNEARPVQRLVRLRYPQLTRSSFSLQDVRGRLPKLAVALRRYGGARLPATCLGTATSRCRQNVMPGARLMNANRAEETESPTAKT
jgi:hypothetical protein